ncbi:alpha/beta hydrolase family protein [Sporanaerobium hydrogeniformans]|uniref:alpha/beta hydrolase family protein n=1 Tax=Sporanaerobium hydrogeniformans TaxID=3072179 RepID=UPI0015D4FF18|nr:dienelactone hydrolase family protein [Sporanaerobium hydrogeniformans]
MLVTIVLLIAIGIEIFLGILSLKKDKAFEVLEARVRLGELLVFVLLILSPIITWNFRWYGLGIVLAFQGVIAIFKAIKNKKSVHRTRIRVIVKLFFKGGLLLFILMPAWLFPENSELRPTGNYGTKTVTYTWTDKIRDETFTPEKDNRKITVQFWYPTKDKQSNQKAEGKFPLIIFSHGAFGIRASNTSTYQELASHGYVVCSIDHTYHALFTKQTDGKVIPCDQGFMKEVNDLMVVKQGEMDQAKYNITQDWLNLRTADMTFCLNEIKTFVRDSNNEEVFSMIAIDKIGLMGHSLGGATAAAVARQVEGIKAVAVIDGTMLGEEIGIKNGVEQVTNAPYPVPILNFYNGASYEKIKEIKAIYPNTVAAVSQKESYQIVIPNAGHMNFTDLALISPVLAKMLGTGTVSASACMKEVNDEILLFFDAYLKDQPIHLPKQDIIVIGKE